MSKAVSNKCKHRRIKIGIITAVLAVLLLNLLIMPATTGIARVESIEVYNGTNKYISFDRGVMLSAHRAGGELAPEETLQAFKLSAESAEYTVDIMEFDLHLTADDNLVLLHDDTVNRTSNATEYFGDDKVKARDKTLAELKELNFGENFQNINGEYPYRGLRGNNIPADVKILTLDEVLTYLTAARPNLLYIIEIKDGGDDGEKAMDLLYQKMKIFNILDNTIVGTFQNNVTKYMDNAYPDVVRSASVSEFLDFYYSYLYGIKKDYKFKVLQIPQGFKGLFNFGAKSFIDYAHSLDIAVQYWTINDADDVKALVKAGADAIMTDNPEMAYDIIKA